MSTRTRSGYPSTLYVLQEQPKQSKLRPEDGTRVKTRNAPVAHISPEYEDGQHEVAKKRSNAAYCAMRCNTSQYCNPTPDVADNKGL